MTTSDSIKNIAKGLALFHVKVGKIKKESTNPYFSSKYADLPSILEAIEVPMQEAGLVFSQHPTGDNSLCTLIIHAESGEYMMSEYNMKPVKNDPQAVGSAITYARRYALGAILGLNIDVDDDGNAGSGNQHQQPARNAQQATKQAQGDDNKPWLNEDSKEFKAIEARIKKGENVTLETIRQHFKVSKQTRAALEMLLPNVTN